MGRVTSRTDGNGQQQSITYDTLDRPVRVDYADGTSTTSAFDYDGNLTTTTDALAAGSQSSSYRYDLRNREVGRTGPAGAQSSLTYDAVGNILTATDGGGSITYCYDAANELVSLSEPGGSCATNPGTACTRFSYNNNGSRITTDYPTGTTRTVMTVTPDLSGRVGRIRAVTGSTVQSDFSYTYSRMVGSQATDGLMTRTRTENLGSSAALSTTYRYDSLSQLIGAVETDTGAGTAGAWSYAYGLAGNRTSATAVGASQNTFGYNGANQLVSRNGTGGFGYDGNGNETTAAGASSRTSTWNARDQLTSLTTGASTTPFGYAPAGNSTRLTAGNLSYGNTALGTTSQTGQAPPAAASSTLVRDPGGTLIALRTGGSSSYYLYDGQGSVTGLVSNTGAKTNSYSYDPYGISRTRTETVANDPRTGETPTATSGGQPCPHLGAGTKGPRS